MNKSELVEALASNRDLTYKKSEEIVNIIFDAMSETLSSGGRIEIRGFGRFKVKEQPEHYARNPRTNEEVMVERRYKPTFEASNKLRDYVNDSILKNK